jgi:hypothetical protein
MIQQEVFLDEGDTIIGAYFFGTVDYRNYYDYCKISLQSSDPNNTDPNSQITLAHIVIGDVSDFESTLELSPETDGWLTFSHTIEPNQAGPYYLQCEVGDDLDNVYDSFLAVDNLRICRQGRPDADFDWDCDVDLLDFSIISQAWLSYCPDDPNITDPNVADPNIPCQLADLDNSWFVDPNDLIIMSEDWLRNTSAQ